VTGREASEGVVAIDVADRGAGPIPWPPTTSGAGIGLALARTLSQSQGGRLLLAQGPDGTRFTVLVPRSGRSQVDEGIVDP
jgi:signal transduction histidine kinase